MGKVLKARNRFKYFKKFIKSSTVKTLAVALCITLVIVGFYYYNNFRNYYVYPFTELNTNILYNYVSLHEKYSNIFSLGFC